MDAIRFIAQSLAQAQLRLAASCEGLTDAKARWRPGPESNCISFLLWHVSRVEDRIASAELGVETLWAGEDWAGRFGDDVEAPAVLRDRQSALAVPIPDLALLLAYQVAAAERARGLVGGLRSEDLDRPAVDSQGAQLADMLRHLATHKNNHHGQIDFLRGLQQDDWDLPPGTGLRLPEGDGAGA